MSTASGSSRTGKAIEHLVAASCILISSNRLNVSTSLVDDEGVDLVFHRRDQSTTLAVQVKGRTLSSKTLGTHYRFHATVRAATFRPRRDLYLLFVPVDAAKGTFAFVWFVPSDEFRAKFDEPNGRGNFVFSASSKPTSADRWSQFKCQRVDLPGHIIGVLDALAAF